jgi:DNA-binding response OmpR family regulator
MKAATFVTPANLNRSPSDLILSRMSKKILVVDDEPDALELITFNLKAAGYSVITAETGNDAIKKARAYLPDLILLDLMIPETDGIEVCKILRRDEHTTGIPIMMVTAKAEEMDRIVGLELGANDYLTKPFSPRELVLRAKNLLHRTGPLEQKKDRYHFGELVVEVSAHRVAINNKPTDLTATEFRLLLTLIERRGRVQSREALLRDVWKYENVTDTRTIDTHMRRLREKLGKAARHLDTVRGVGYRFEEAAR